MTSCGSVSVIKHGHDQICGSLALMSVLPPTIINITMFIDKITIESKYQIDFF